MGKFCGVFNTITKCKHHICSLATECYQHIKYCHTETCSASRALQCQTLFWRKVPQRQYLHCWADALCSTPCNHGPWVHTLAPCWLHCRRSACTPFPTCTGFLCMEARAHMEMGAEWHAERSPVGTMCRPVQWTVMNYSCRYCSLHSEVKQKAELRIFCASSKCWKDHSYHPPHYH